MESILRMTHVDLDILLKNMMYWNSQLDYYLIHQNGFLFQLHTLISLQHLIADVDIVCMTMTS